MYSLKSFWNGKIIGILGFGGIVISRLIQLIIDEYYSIIVKRNLGKSGKNVKILRGFKYRCPGNISLGDNVAIGQNVIFSTEIETGELKILDNVIIGRNCKIDFSGDITINKGALLSEGVVIQTHDHGLNPRSNPSAKQLEIGENVWIGINSIVLANTKKIGENSIIAAGSIVTKDIPSNCIVAGVPCKVVRENISFD